MDHKVETLELLAARGRMPVWATRPVVMAALTLVVMGAIGAVIVFIVAGLQPAAATGIPAGIEAASTRYQALGAHYESEAVNLARGAHADSARWSGLGTNYVGRYEASAVASGARYQALAQFYSERARRSADASAARWTAIARASMPQHELTAGTSSARCQALAQHWAERAGAPWEPGIWRGTMRLRLPARLVIRRWRNATPRRPAAIRRRRGQSEVPLVGRPRGPGAFPT